MIAACAASAGNELAILAVAFCAFVPLGAAVGLWIARS